MSDDERSKSPGPDQLLSPQARDQMTLLIDRASGGDQLAAEELLPLVYEELRKLASSHMKREASGNTLQATALVHEAYVRLLGGHEGTSDWNSRGHFFGAAAIAMRRILIERARARATHKRGGDRTRVDLHENAAAVDANDAEKAEALLLLDAALTRLESLDARKARVVMLRYYAGLSIEQTAQALNISPATVKGDWVFARAWLSKEIESSQK
jgi:RNA polymerase sigma factor (TIGR02999 family)